MSPSQPPASHLDQRLALGLQHHQAGQLAQAEAIYREILARNPAHADALHLLGVIACQVGQHAAAIDLISRAVSVNPRHPAYHSNLGESCSQAGQTERALAEFCQALLLDPAFADAYQNMGLCLFRAGRATEALEVFSKGVKVVPAHAVLHRHHGDMLIKAGRGAEAIAAYQKALRLDPRQTEAEYNLGVALASSGAHAEAVAAFRRVVAATPEDLDARVRLAVALEPAGRSDEAVTLFQSVLARDPRHFEALTHMANILRAHDRVDDAIAAFRLALEVKPGDPVTYANLAFALRDYAQFDEAIALLDQAAAGSPESLTLQSALIFTLWAHPRVTRARIAAEERRWNQMIPAASRIAAAVPHANDRTSDRRLHIGYVSADLRVHPVGRFMRPLLANHDRSQVAVYCYSASSRSDAVTTELRGLADEWRQISALGDAEVADQIRRDQIDILIDLSMHTIDNRLPVFAMKPAPIQMTYLAYCGGTGLNAIDYRLTDRYLDPPEMVEVGASPERPLRLESYWCYAVPATAGDVTALPASSAGHMTFGSLNYFTKVNDDVLALWARVLEQVPGSRLHLHVPSGSRHAYVEQFFAQRGIDARRLTLLPRVTESEYFGHYGRIDIGLDTFPFAGGTTTCDALWMGVPVVTLAGERTVTRGGASIMSTVGLPELIAHSSEEYVALAVGLAADLDRLSALRAELRPRIASSRLMDAPHFVRNLEDVYRSAWRTWLHTQSVAADK